MMYFCFYIFITRQIEHIFYVKEKGNNNKKIIIIVIILTDLKDMIYKLT